MIAGLVAWYLAFVFDLEQPQWALTTVFFFAQSSDLRASNTYNSAAWPTPRRLGKTLIKIT